MKNRHFENKKEYHSKELDEFKLKGFKDLQHQYFNDIKLEDFQKERLKEFNNVELKSFKEFMDELEVNKSIENLKVELNSKDTIKNILKELQDIRINGKQHLKLLKMLKREIPK